MLWGGGLDLLSNLGGWEVWRGVWGIDALGRGVGSGQQLGGLGGLEEGLGD